MLLTDNKSYYLNMGAVNGLKILGLLLSITVIAT